MLGTGLGRHVYAFLNLLKPVGICPVSELVRHPSMQVCDRLDWLTIGVKPNELSARNRSGSSTSNDPQGPERERTGREIQWATNWAGCGRRDRQQNYGKGSY